MQFCLAVPRLIPKNFQNYPELPNLPPPIGLKKFVWTLWMNLLGLCFFCFFFHWTPETPPKYSEMFGLEQALTVRAGHPVCAERAWQGKVRLLRLVQPSRRILSLRAQERTFRNFLGLVAGVHWKKQRKTVLKDSSKELVWIFSARLEAAAWEVLLVSLYFKKTLSVQKLTVVNFLALSENDLVFSLYLEKNRFFWEKFKF